MPTRLNRQQCKHSWNQIKSFTFRASKYYFSFNFNNVQVFFVFSTWSYSLGARDGII